MTRGTKCLSNSKCNCGLHDRTVRPYGHITGSGALFLKGYCRSCNGKKSLPYTKEQLDLEGDGIKKFFKNVWTKGIKPMGRKVGAKILNDPPKAFRVASQIGAAATSKNPQAMLTSAMQAGKFLSAKGVKIGDLTSGGSLYLYRKKFNKSPKVNEFFE